MKMGGRGLTEHVQTTNIFIKSQMLNKNNFKKLVLYGHTMYSI